MRPIAPVRATCVPPHAERSKPSTSMSRSGPSRTRLLPQRQRRRFLGRREADRDRPVLPDDAVGFVHGALDVGRRGLALQVDRGHVAAHVEAHRAVVEQPIERGRQHVLARVLLHVIEASRPVDLAVSRAPPSSERPRHDVHDVVVQIHGLDDRHVRRDGRCRTAGRRRWDRTPCDRASPRGGLRDRRHASRRPRTGDSRGRV